jgi:putative endonuclease
MVRRTRSSHDDNAPPIRSAQAPAIPSRQRLGNAGEARTAAWYRRRGYEVLARNWRCRNGELDLIVRRDDTLVFCEVKTRRSRRFGHPAEAVTAPKQRRIRQLATVWLRTSGVRAGVVRFDVAAVEGTRVEVIQGAF